MKKWESFLYLSARQVCFTMSLCDFLSGLNFLFDALGLCHHLDNLRHATQDRNSLHTQMEEFALTLRLIE